ncbi:hypothetical protein B4N89_42035 [Embleya scabrispora]|uniref:D-inositol 3-phosphate glycosyltransferase n=2 Tax=Embleya scabrispora TaxID=159449 RepID=A0A1T3NK37_9ACTN|nr:hypothetical protein B4N89_42035 [Embleya scabrispora]
MVRAYLPVPRPPDIPYAPLDVAVDVALGLQRRGHDVDFYAPLGSVLDVPVKTLGMRSLVTTVDEWVAWLADIKPHLHYVAWLRDFAMARDMFECASRGVYDVLLFHHPEVALPFVERYPRVRVVSVLHDPLFPWYADMFAAHRSPASHLVSISDRQRNGRDDLPFAATIHHGVDVDTYAFGVAEADAPLLFAGRITPEKGAAEAVRLALAAGRELVLCGGYFPAQEKYFEDTVRPFLGSQIRYAGYQERENLVSYDQQASALLAPIDCEESFGLTMIEAMACGTPVLTLDRGSVPEVVKHRETGFIASDLRELERSITGIADISRRRCREHVVGNFTTDHMITRYENLFTDLVYGGHTRA